MNGIQILWIHASYGISVNWSNKEMSAFFLSFFFFRFNVGVRMISVLLLLFFVDITWIACEHLTKS